MKLIFFLTDSKYVFQNVHIAFLQKRLKLNYHLWRLWAQRAERWKPHCCCVTVVWVRTIWLWDSFWANAASMYWSVCSFLGKECHSSLFLSWCCSYLVYSENNGGGLPVCSEHAWSPANTGQGKYNMTTKLHTFSSLRVKKEQKLHKWVNTGTDWRTGQERAEILAGKRPVNPVRFSLCVPLPKQTRTACTVYLHRRKRNECKGLEFGWDPT